MKLSDRIKGGCRAAGLPFMIGVASTLGVGVASAQDLADGLTATLGDGAESTALPRGVPPVASQEGSDTPPAETATRVAVRVQVTAGGLTADDAARRAAANNQQLKAKLAHVRAADAELREARTGFIPSLKLSGRYTRLSPTPNSTFGDLGSGGLVTTQDPTPRVIDPANDQLFASPGPNLSFAPVLDQYSAGATISVPLSDYVLRVANIVETKDRDRAAKVLGERAARLSVARDARVTYFEWVRLKESSLVAQQAVMQARESHQYASALFAAGIASRADVLRTQSQIKRAEMHLRRAMTAVDISVERLRLVLGDAPSVNYQVGQDILVEPPSIVDERLTPEMAFLEAKQRRSELKMLREQELALRQAADVVGVDNYPRLDARANFEIVNPNPRRLPQRNEPSPLWDVSVVLSWTPTNWFGNDAKSDSIIAQAEALTAQQRQMENGLRHELGVALASLGDARYAVQDARERLAVSEEGYQVRLTMFRASQARLVEVLDADRDLTQARLELINAHVELHVANAQLMHALGREAN